MRMKFALKIFLFFLFFASFSINLTPANAVLSIPTITYPKSSDSPVWAGKIEFKWSNTGADYYKYHINLPSGESREGITNVNSYVFYDLELGNYITFLSDGELVSSNGKEGGDYEFKEGRVLITLHWYDDWHSSYNYQFSENYTKLNLYNVNNDNSLNYVKLKN